MADLKAIEARAAALEAAQRELNDEVREARRPRGSYKALDIAKRNAAASRGLNGGFKSLGHFAQIVKSFGSNWERSKELTAYVKALPSGMNESVGADGAYLIPPQFLNDLLMRTYDNDLLSRVSTIPMTSNKLSVPAISETSRANGSRFGGVQAYWDGEAETVTATKPKFMTVDLMPSALTAMVRVTDELLQDAPALEQFIDAIVAQELAFKIGDAIVNGDGVKKPLGFLNAPCKVAVAKEVGQAAATVYAENVVNMWSRLYAPSRSNAVWLVNQQVEPQLQLMTIGVAGSQLAVYLPPGGLNASPYGSLMGRPVVPVEFCSALGTEGDIILVDPSQYLMGTIGGVQSATSMHLYFDSRETAFRFVMRADGKPWWLSALTPFKGSATLSPIVTLATRA